MTITANITIAKLRKLLIGFPFVYLNFTLAHSKCQGQYHSQIDYEQIDKTELFCISSCQHLRYSFLFLSEETTTTKDEGKIEFYLLAASPHLMFRSACKNTTTDGRQNKTRSKVWVD